MWQEFCQVRLLIAALRRQVMLMEIIAYIGLALGIVKLSWDLIDKAIALRKKK